MQKWDKIKEKVLKKIIVIFLVPYYTFSISTGEGAWNTLKVNNPSPINGSLSDVFKDVIGGLIDLSIPLLVLAYVYVGFLFVQSVGKKDGLDRAKKALMYTIIGTFVILGSGLILEIVKNTTQELTDI